MQLFDYLKLEETNRANFAKKCGISTSTMSRLIRGLVDPSWDTMRKIERASGGKVTAADWSARDKYAA
jgi:transcriptional regulator with XRE-family HTH domain